MMWSTIRRVLSLCLCLLLFTGMQTPSLAVSVQAMPSTQQFKVNDTVVPIQSYVIAGENYSRIADLASVLNFSVVYNSETNSVLIDNSEPYGGKSVTLSPIKEAEAKPSSQIFYLNGNQIPLTAYAIAGQNYVRVRDVASYMNIYVSYDSAANCVMFNKLLDYSGNPLQENIKNTGDLVIADGSSRISDIPYNYKLVDGTDVSREDFSQNANPEIFNDRWTRGMYNAAYQTYIDRDVITEKNNEKNFNPYYAYASAIEPNFDGSNNFDAPLSDISKAFSLQISVEPYVNDYYKYPGYLIVKVWSCNITIDNATSDILNKAKSLSTNEKLKVFTGFVRSRIIYDAKSAASISKVFTTAEPVKGACGTYASSFQYLCEQAGIPIIGVSGDNHAWTMVYIDGEWLHCDPTGGTIMAKTTKYKFYDTQRVEFSKEILVPGSTVK